MKYYIIVHEDMKSPFEMKVLLGGKSILSAIRTWNKYNNVPLDNLKHYKEMGFKTINIEVHKK